MTTRLDAPNEFRRLSTELTVVYDKMFHQQGLYLTKEEVPIVLAALIHAAVCHHTRHDQKPDGGV